MGQPARHVVELLECPRIAFTGIDIVAGHEPIPQAGPALCEGPIEGGGTDSGRDRYLGRARYLEQRVEVARQGGPLALLSIIVHRWPQVFERFAKRTCRILGCENIAELLSSVFGDTTAPDDTALEEEPKVSAIAHVGIAPIGPHRHDEAGVVEREHVDDVDLLRRSAEVAARLHWCGRLVDVARADRPDQSNLGA